MRLVLTIVSPRTRQSTDIVLDAAPETPIGEIAAELGRFAGLPSPSDTGPLGWRGPLRAQRMSPHRALPPRGTRPSVPPPTRRARPSVPPPRAPLSPSPLPRVPLPRGPLPRTPQPRLPQLRIPQPRVPVQDTRGPLPLTPPVVAVAPVALYVDGQRIAPTVTLADSPIKDGTVISLGGAAGRTPPQSAGLVEIRIVAGPGAGAVYRLPTGEADIGSGQKATVKVPGRSVPARAASVVVDKLGGCRVTAADQATVLLDQAPLTWPTPWRPGQQLTVGTAILELLPYRPPDATLSRSADGAGVNFHRPPRLLPSWPAATFVLPARPTLTRRRMVVVIAALLPLVAGLASAMLKHQAWLLAIAGACPTPLLGGALPGRRGHRPPAGLLRLRAEAEYDERKARIEQEAADALAAERAALREQFPDPAALMSIVSGPRPRLWERRRSDDDYLTLRLGTAVLPSTVQVIDPLRYERRRAGLSGDTGLSGLSGSTGRSGSTGTWPLPDAPVTIALPEQRVVGVAGAGDSGRGVGRWLVAQAAVLHSPNDLRIYVLTDGAGEKSWAWVRWLPHCRPGIGSAARGVPGPPAAFLAGGKGAGDYLAQVGNDVETVGARVTELLGIIARRRDARDRRSADAEQADSGQAKRDQAPFLTDILVVIDGSRELSAQPPVIRLLREGPDVGVYAICLDADDQLLPAECQAVAVIDRDVLRVRQALRDPVAGGRPDRVLPGWCLRAGRALAPVRDASTRPDRGGALPG